MATPGCFGSSVRKIFCAIALISASENSSIASTVWIASTGLPSTFGSRSAMRFAPRIAAASVVRFSTGTGQNRPAVVCSVAATLSASALFM